MFLYKTTKTLRYGFGTLKPLVDAKTQIFGNAWRKFSCTSRYNTEDTNSKQKHLKEINDNKQPFNQDLQDKATNISRYRATITNHVDSKEISDYGETTWPLHQATTDVGGQLNTNETPSTLTTKLSTNENPSILPANRSTNETQSTLPAAKSISQQFETLGSVYSKATGSFKHTWNTDVNLGPPRSRDGQTAVGDSFITDYYNSLQYTLLETGYPETEDRTGVPRSYHCDERVTVAIMASPCECIGLLLRGGEKLPDGFLLILSPSWLSQTRSTIDPALNALYVHKAITFQRGGHTFIDEFVTPRRVTYFINFFTKNITGGQRSDGEPFEVNIDCPISSPIRLSEIVDNKMWTRNIMAEVGMIVPETIAFIYQPKLRLESVPDKLTIVEVMDKSEGDIHQHVTGFLNTLDSSRGDVVVVKPSGPNVYGSIGVSYHNRDHVTSICQSIRQLLDELEPGSAVLVERFIQMSPRDRTVKQNENVKQWFSDSRHSFRLRATVCRDFNNEPVTTMINCGLAPKFDPINGDNTITQSLNSTLIAFGVHDVHERRYLDVKIRTQCEDVLRGIMEKEKQFDHSLVGAVNGQTDVIGVDMCVEDQNGTLVPVGIEVNSHDCLINCQIYDFMQDLYNRTVPRSHDDDCRSYTSQAYDPLIRNIVVRSQQYLMQDKVVLVVGAGGYSKRFIWLESAKYGIKVILVDNEEPCPVKDQVYRFIFYDFTDHKQDEQHAAGIAQILQDSNLAPDGCLTFWEDCGPLAALLREKLDLSHGASYEAALTGKKKSRTQDLLQTRNDDIPHWPRTYLYSSPVWHVNSQESVDNVSERINYPAMLKLEHGSSAVGVTLVNNQTELREAYTQISSQLQIESDFPGIGLGHDNSMVVTQYHQGSEHDVDVVIFDRKLVAAFISDNAPTRVPRFTETAALMQSSLPRDKQAQLVVAAYQCCTEIGLTDGTFNVELKMTPTGPKLIEINARMGGFYIRDWIKRLYNVDLMLTSLMISCGIKPYVPKTSSASYVIGVMLLPSIHEKVLSSDTAKDLIAKGDIILNKFSETAEVESDNFEEPFANIAVEGRTINEAKQKLLRFCEQTRVSNDQYDVSEFLKSF